MGSSEFESNEEGNKPRVEYTSLSLLFEELCPIYMGYGMTYDEYWYDDCFKTVYYRKTYEIQIKQTDEKFWMQGMYIYDALCRVSPILHAFSKSGTKPLPYPDKPYSSSSEQFMSEEEKQQKIKNEQLIAQLHFEKWARATAKQFENKNKE